MKKINVSNTTLSYNRKGTIKFDAKQARRRDFGQAHCRICDEVFTKLSGNCFLCSPKCRRVRASNLKKAYREKNPDYRKAYLEKNREKIRAKERAYREKNREKISDRQRAWYKKNKMRRN